MTSDVCQPLFRTTRHWITEATTAAWKLQSLLHFSGMETTDGSRQSVTRSPAQLVWWIVFLGAPVPNRVLDRKSDIPRAICSCSSCVVTFYWIRTGLSGRERETDRGEKIKKTEPWQQRRRKTLSTCSKTQCTVLKTVKAGIFREWAKSRLQGSWDRDESSREQRKWGLRRRHLENCLLLTGSQPGETPWKLTKHTHCV